MLNSARAGTYVCARVHSCSSDFAWVHANCYGCTCLPWHRAIHMLVGKHAVSDVLALAMCRAHAMQAMGRLSLNDASVSVVRENSDALGAGFRQVCALLVAISRHCWWSGWCPKAELLDGLHAIPGSTCEVCLHRGKLARVVQDRVSITSVCAWDLHGPCHPLCTCMCLYLFANVARKSMEVLLLRG